MSFSNNAPLSVSQSAQFNGVAGAVLTVSKGPQLPGEQWVITRISVSTNSSTETTCRIYRNFVGDAQFLDGTFSGNQDVSDTDITLRQGEQCVVQWTDGASPPGSAAGTVPTGSVRLEGERRFQRMN